MLFFFQRLLMKSKVRFPCYKCGAQCCEELGCYQQLSGALHFICNACSKPYQESTIKNAAIKDKMRCFACGELKYPYQGVYRGDSNVSHWFCLNCADSQSYSSVSANRAK